MKVYLLYDYGDLVNLYTTEKAAEAAAEPLRRDAIAVMGDDRGIEVVEATVHD